MRRAGTDRSVGATKAGNAAGAKGSGQVVAFIEQLYNRRKLMSVTKQFSISQYLVREAHLTVKSNAGAAGIDKESIEDFEKNLIGNLYKIWNRMSSRSYFPPAVRAVAIPKKGGGERIICVPTVGDRVAQTVVRMVFEPDVERIFLSDSYGYRPGKSALDAIRITRERCWKYSC